MKIFKLFINENIKTWKKGSTKVLIFIVLLSLVCVLGLVKLMQKLDSNSNYNEMTIQSDKEGLKAQIEYLEEELKNGNLDDISKRNMQIELEEYQLYLDYDINAYGNTWRNELVTKIANAKVENNTEEIEKMINILKENNFEKYMEEQKQILKKQLEINAIDQKEYDDGILIIDLKIKYDIGNDKTTYSWKSLVISEIERSQASIRNGINQENNKVLKADEKQKLEDLIKIDIYRLEHNIPSSEVGSNSNFRMRFEMISPIFVVAIISIVAMIIAGGAISTETTEGTIKFWALTPNKRWKILTAKILSILFYIILITLIMSVLSVLIANVFFQDDGETYLYVQNGQVKEIGNTLYTIEYYLTETIPVILFTIFALMLSTVTRNTAISVSVSIGLYMGNGIFMAIINSFVTKDWIRYIPFNNLDITSKIFPNASDLLGTGANVFAKSNSLEFSLAVLGVCLILMLVTMYDSFNKRDII